jgi:hypothetical protein
MWIELVQYVDFSSISLFQTMSFVLAALALILPWLGVEWAISSLEEIYWVSRFSEPAPFFTLPPEIAALPLELSEDKTLHCLPGGEVVEPEGSEPPVRAKQPHKDDNSSETDPAEVWIEMQEHQYEGWEC